MMDATRQGLTKLELTTSILQKGFRFRTAEDLNELVPLIKEIKFFKDRDIKD